MRGALLHDWHILQAKLSERGILLEAYSSMMQLSEEAVIYASVRRLVRVGACVVLEVTVTYPMAVAGTEGCDRFCAVYREAAEAFVHWALGEPASLAREAFSAMGTGAAYRFDRWCLSCRFEVVREEADDRYAVVTRTVISGRRRGGEERRCTSSIRWCLEDGTVRRASRVERRIGSWRKRSECAEEGHT